MSVNYGDLQNVIYEKLPWTEFCKAHSEGKISIATNRQCAIKAAKLKLIFSYSSFFLAFLGYLSFITSVVCSFIFAWWCFIVGLFFFWHFLRSSTSADVKALNKAILVNREIYDCAIDNHWIIVCDVSGYMNSEEHKNKSTS